MKNILLIFCLLIEGGSISFAAKPEVSAFIDTYYAYDFNKPLDFDRSYTTQPARHNEFNVNLAYIDAKISEEKFRARFALQAGTSVQSNYSSEPTKGIISGASLSRHIQEAVGGFQPFKDFWIDAGIYLSHVGAESFISKDNILYTRSLVADYSPYYQSGVRFSYSPLAKLSLQLHVVNGWQNISESNGLKTIGTQANYNFSDKTSITYNTLLGNESSFRQFHDLIFKTNLFEKWTINLQADIGKQKRTWYGFSYMNGFHITDKLTFTNRLEYYSDKNQIIITTNTPRGFQTWSASIGSDIKVHEKIMWRSELRGYRSQDRIFPSKYGLKINDGVIVTSLGIQI